MHHSGILTRLWHTHDVPAQRQRERHTGTTGLIERRGGETRTWEDQVYYKCKTVQMHQTPNWTPSYWRLHFCFLSSCLCAHETIEITTHEFCLLLVTTSQQWPMTTELLTSHTALHHRLHTGRLFWGKMMCITNDTIQKHLTTVPLVRNESMQYGSIIKMGNLNAIITF